MAHGANGKVEVLVPTTNAPRKRCLGFPLQHRDHVLIQFEAPTATYHLHDGVADILKQLKS
eukprot:2988167-Prymnesium_polylepis.3